MNDHADCLHKSVIVAAHPDDEILWFSSVINKVDEVILCFLDVQSQREWSEGRRKVISAYPMPNLSSLDIDESEVFDGADWSTPAATEYGMDIVKTKGAIARYKNNFFTLKELLVEKLKGYTNVYTHNPWGEYGHEEHVQVYRAVKSLQSTMSFNLWYTNYFSNKSLHYMNEYIGRAGLVSFCRPTNASTAIAVRDLYKCNRCWTWYDDYAWPDYECFILDDGLPTQSNTLGKTLSLNFVKIPVPQKKKSALSSLVNRTLRSVAKIFR